MNRCIHINLLPFKTHFPKIILILFLFSAPIFAQTQFQKHIVGGGDLAANGVSFIAAIDLDGDGNKDIVSASRADNKVVWYENDGNENFTSHVVTTNAEGACAVCIVDLDGDGDIDIISGSWAKNEISWYENDGTQNFTSHSVIDYSEVANSIFAEDVDNDGDIDIISTSHSFDNRKIAWYENDGAQNFTIHLVGNPIVGIGPIITSDLAICVGDLNNDGNIDIISTGDDNKVTWYKNNGNKIFSPQFIGLTCFGAKSVSVTDINNDGYLDVFTICQEKFTIYENDGNENFSSHTFSDTSSFISITSICSTDLDRDGNVDFVLSDYNSGKIIWYKNDGNNNFNSINIIDSQWDVNSILTMDLNGDGNIDILSASDDLIMWYENDGNEKFTYYIISASVGDDNKVISADLDNDGDMDILSASTYYYHGMGDYFFPPRHGKIFWFENDFRNKYKYHIIDSFDENALSVNVADIDNDGSLDVIGSFSSFNSKISWYKINGKEDFKEFLIVDSIAFISSIFPIDVDGDFDIDILCAVGGGWDSFGSKILWYENVSNGEFKYHFITDSLWDVKSIFAIDIDLDGDTDILSASFHDNKIVCHENDSFENFKPHTISSEAKGAESVLAIDLDNDGDIDVVSGSNEDNKIAWYENDGNEIFTEHIVVTNIFEISSINVSDLDGDGYLDLIPSLRLPHEYTWYRNDGHYNFEAIIENSMSDLLSAYPIDMDNDGDCDLVTAGNEIGFGYINLYENLDTSIVGFIKSEELLLPKVYILFQNYPNPFNPNTTIKYIIPIDLRYEYQDVRLSVFDILGREVATLVNQKQKPGNYEVNWNVDNLPSGVYFYKLTSGNFIESKKMILLK